jgi:hypothetical protein
MGGGKRRGGGMTAARQFGGEMRALDGIIAVLVDIETGDEVTKHYPGLASREPRHAGTKRRTNITHGVLDSVREACQECDRRGPNWRIAVISSPSSILTDMDNHGAFVIVPSLSNERRATSEQSGRRGKRSHEEAMLDKIGRRDLAITPSWASEGLPQREGPARRSELRPRGWRGNVQ